MACGANFESIWISPEKKIYKVEPVVLDLAFVQREMFQTRRSGSMINVMSRDPVDPDIELLMLDVETFEDAEKIDKVGHHVPGNPMRSLQLTMRNRNNSRSVNWIEKTGSSCCDGCS